MLPSFLGLRDRAEIWQLTLQVVTGGILLTVAVEQMVAQAHEAWGNEDKGGARNSPALATGFALFALLSQLFGRPARPHSYRAGEAADCWEILANGSSVWQAQPSPCAACTSSARIPQCAASAGTWQLACSKAPRQSEW